MVNSAYGIIKTLGKARDLNNSYYQRQLGKKDLLMDEAVRWANWQAIDNDKIDRVIAILRQFEDELDDYLVSMDGGNVNQRKNPENAQGSQVEVANRHPVPAQKA